MMTCEMFPPQQMGGGGGGGCLLFLFLLAVMFTSVCSTPSPHTDLRRCVKFTAPPGVCQDKRNHMVINGAGLPVVLFFFLSKSAAATR